MVAGSLLYPQAGIPEDLPEDPDRAAALDGPEVQAIDQARLSHLASLGLPIDGRSVLDVGCGIGNLAHFFVERRCRVTCIDGRSENIQTVKQRLSGVAAHVANVETDLLARFGRFEIVFCYGLLHHLENPVAGLRNLADVCAELLLLETVVTDHELPLVRVLDEPHEQASGGLGCRPTPAFIAMALTRVGFHSVYAPCAPPNHPDFRFEWGNNLDCRRRNHLLRCIFVASRKPLDNPNLDLILSGPETKAKSCFVPMALTEVRRTWLDVGAHLGEKTFSAAQNDPRLRVYAFEPNLQIGSRRMGELPNYVVLPLAVAEQDGVAEFYVNEFAPASSLLPFTPQGLKQWNGKKRLRVARTITAPTIRLDTFMQQTGIGKVEFLKICAQGTDLAVLRSCGTRLDDIERISLDVQNAAVPLYRGSSSKQDVIDFLEAAGFELEFTKTRNMGRPENLTFVRHYQDSAAALSDARQFSFGRPLNPYPGWRFDADWDSPDPLIQRRRRIWSYFNRRHLDAAVDFAWYHPLKLTLYLGNDESRALFVGGCCDPNEFAFLDKFLQPGMVVVDAGANTGLYTVFAAHHIQGAGQVLAFEPSARELNRLKTNLERNTLTNVTLYSVALGERDRQALLHIANSEHAGQNTLGAFAYPSTRLLRDEPVRVRTLDGVLAEHGAQRLDLLKLDVEGGETGVIKGACRAIERYRPVLLFEVSDAALRNNSSSAEELLEIVSSLDYLVYVFDSESGLLRRARPGEQSDNMIAAPSETPLPEAWCASTRYDDGKDPQPLEYEREPLTAEAALFEISEREICQGAALSKRGVFSLTTDAERWSYAARFPIRETARTALPPYSRIALQIEAVVRSGSIGIGIVAADGSTYLTPEVERSANKQAVSFSLSMPGPPPGVAVVVRNTSPDGSASKVSIRSLSSFICVPVRPSAGPCAPDHPTDQCNTSSPNEC